MCNRDLSVLTSMPFFNGTSCGGKCYGAGRSPGNEDGFLSAAFRKDNFVLSTELNWPLKRHSKADVSSASPS